MKAKICEAKPTVGKTWRITIPAFLALAALTAIPAITHAGYHDGMNLYQYVASSPTRYLDPSGLDYITPPPQVPVPHTVLKPTGSGGTTYGWNRLATGRVDLVGSSHGGVPTPHTHIQSINIRPSDGRVFSNAPGSNPLPGTPASNPRAAQSISSNIAQTADDAARAAGSTIDDAARAAASSADDVARATARSAGRAVARPVINPLIILTVLDLTASSTGLSAELTIADHVGGPGRHGDQCIRCICKEYNREIWYPKTFNFKNEWSKELSKEKVVVDHVMTRRKCLGYDKGQIAGQRNHDMWWKVVTYKGISCNWRTGKTIGKSAKLPWGR